MDCMHESEKYCWLLPLIMPPSTKKGSEFLGVVAMFHVVLAEDFYHLLGIYSLHVMQWKNNLHFFSMSVKYQRRAPAERRIDRAGRGMNFSAAIALPFSPFLSFPVGSVDTLPGREAAAAWEVAELHLHRSTSLTNWHMILKIINTFCGHLSISHSDYPWQQMFHIQ